MEKDDVWKGRREDRVEIKWFRQNLLYGFQMMFIEDFRKKQGGI